MRRRCLLLFGSLAAVAASLAMAVSTASTAGAVQTTTWGIVAAPTTGGQFRSVLSHPANGATVHDAVVVFNRSKAPLTVHLSLLDATRADNTFQFGSHGIGLAERTTLAAPSVTLGVGQQARVPVTIKTPNGGLTAGYAAIAAEARPVQDGAISVQQRLIVLIETPATGHPVVAGGKGDTGRAIGIGVLILLLVVIAFLIREYRKWHRRRQGHNVTADGPPSPAMAGVGGLSEDRV